MAVFDRTSVRSLVVGKTAPVQKYTSNWVLDPQAPPRHTHTGVSPAFVERQLCLKPTLGPAPCPPSALEKAKMLTTPLPPERRLRMPHPVLHRMGACFLPSQRCAPLASACGAVRPCQPWYTDPLCLPLPEGVHARRVMPPAPLPACSMPGCPKQKHAVAQYILDVVP